MESVNIEGLRALPFHHDAPRLYAGFWRRVAAWFIDALILAAAHAMLVMLFGTWLLVPWALLGSGYGEVMAKVVDAGLQPFGIVLAWLYFAACEASHWQATLGKLAVGLQVTDVFGQRIGFARASGRYFGKFVSALILGIGFLLAGWTARKQALHDFMAGCLVVREGGLQAWRNAGAASAGNVRQPIATPGMPGWAIALIVVGGSVFVVVPVLAILAAIAIPAYQGYVVRAEISQGLALTERPRALIGEYIGQRGALPGGNAALGLPKPEAINARYVTSVRVAGGKVVVTYGNQANPAIRGGHVVISPYGNAALLHWRCSSPDIHERYLPQHCR